LVLLLSVLWSSALVVFAGELSEVSPVQPPELSLPDLAGEQRSLKEFAGKVLLVNFWASWCQPCIDEMPSIERLKAALADQPFAVVGVNVAEAERRVNATVQRLGITFPVLLDKDSAAFKGWGASVLPTAYVLDGRGRVRYVGRGPVEWDRVDIVDMMVRLARQEADRGKALEERAEQAGSVTGDRAEE
jgi:thiol-disulfide isomerase/thioredoxin